MKKITFLFCLLAFLANNTFSQISLVKDIVTSNESSWPSNYLEGDGFVLFTVFGASTDVWASDGTEAGTVNITVNISDIFNVDQQSILLNGFVYFIIDNGGTGSELYKTDGTLAGTSIVKDINLNFGSSPSNLTVFNNKVYFTADDGANGTQLWATDGTEAGTIVVSTTPEFPNNLMVVNNTLFFTAESPNEGEELWKSDGTEAGTILVKDINNGLISSFPSGFFNANGTLYFTADDGTHGSELWKSDGTEPGTAMVKDIVNGNIGSQITDLIYVNNTLFFTADDGINGSELWKSDGTEAGTSLLKDLEPGATSSSVLGIKPFGNKILFIAKIAATGYEPWISDGTTAGTTMLKDINAGAESSITPFGDINTQILNGEFYFQANNGVNGSNNLELWKTDGTEAGTVMVKNINTDAVVENGKGLTGGLFLINNKIIFEAFDTTHNRELWQSDGTTAGTVILKDINAGKGWGTDLQGAKLVGNKLYFSGSNGNDGFELWVSDGTSAGTVQVKNIVSNPDSSNPTNYTKALNKIYFSADSIPFGSQRLYVSDGTAIGTHQVGSVKTPKAMIEYKGKLVLSSTDLAADYGIFSVDANDNSTLIKKINLNGFSNITEFYHFSVTNELFFAADDGTNGKELWKTDGTEAGTMMVKDLVAGGSGNSIINFTEFNNELYFMAKRSTGGSTSIRSLWKTDGTEAGTMLLKEFSNTNSSPLPYFTEYNGKLYFSAYYQPNGGTHLWKTDGTIAGTEAAWVGFNNPKHLVVIGGNLFMAAYNNASGQEMWMFDGTDATLFKEFLAGSGNGYYPFLNKMDNGIYYFSAYNGTDYSLWKTDGTLANTTKISDTGNNLISQIAIGNSHIYYRFDDGVNGGELWQSDGTQAGTEMVQDLFTGADQWGTNNSGNPEYLTIFGTDLYFTATDAVNGREFFKIENVALGVDNYTTSSDFIKVKISPNPTSDFITISSNETTVKNIQIFNIIGKKIDELSNINQNTFNVSHLKTGLYLIKINTDKGSITKKILKK